MMMTKLILLAMTSLAAGFMSVSRTVPRNHALHERANADERVCKWFNLLR